MVTTQRHNLSLLQHLRGSSGPFRVPRGGFGPAIADRELHQHAYRDSPVSYALAGLADAITPAQKARLVFQVLEPSRIGLSDEQRQTLDRVAALLLCELPDDVALGVFLALRRARANHKHVTRTVARYLLNHPRLERLVQERRPSVADALEHALGRDVVRGAVRRLHENGPGDAYVRRHLLTWADQPGRVIAALLWLHGLGPRPDVSSELPAAPQEKQATERPRTVTATNRGDVSATLVHLYQGGDNVELRRALTGFVDEAVRGLPRFEGRVGLVLDASVSTVGYGERRYCGLAQSMALRLMLERCAAQVDVQVAGGRDVDGLARPEGDTDLAGALLDVLEHSPDIVAIVSDGYENVEHGDLGRVAASLPAAGVETPVVFCQSQFTHKDDLTYRVPAPDLPQIEFWHQDDLAGVLWTLFASARAPHGERFLHQQLAQRLRDREKEGRQWISNSSRAR